MSATPERVRPEAIRRLLDDLDDADDGRRRRVLDDFWAVVRRSGTPLIERAPDGDRYDVTFLHRSADDASPVLAMNGLPRDRPADAAMTRIPGTDVNYAGYRLPPDQQSTYRIAATATTTTPSNGDDWRRLMMNAQPDPLNPATLPGRWDQPASSLLRLPDAPRSVDLEADHQVPDASRGRLEVRTMPSRALLADRDVWCYRPAGDHDQPLSLLVLCDGDRWFGDLGLQRALDQMIMNGSLPPLAVLAPDSVDLDTRWHDLAGSDSFLTFLAEEMIRQSPLPVSDDPARTVIAGQSLGGLTALYAALRRPDRFGVVLGQSVSLWWRPGLPPGRPQAPEDGSCWVADQFAAADRLPTEVALQVGRLEGDMVGWSSDLADTLRARGVPTSRTVYSGGHDYAWWIGGMLEGLGRLLTQTSTGHELFTPTSHRRRPDQAGPP